MKLCAVLITGHVDHSARVLRVITWNKSFRGLPLSGEGGKDDIDADDNETLAIVLDKMLAWEKKLFEEVKVHSFNSFISRLWWTSFSFGLLMLLLKTILCTFRIPIIFFEYLAWKFHFPCSRFCKDYCS